MTGLSRQKAGAEEHFEVVVVGGGTAGVAAAVGAADTGARVLLAERSSVLGGAATLRNVLGYCGLYTCEDLPRKAVGGVADRALARLGELGGVSRYTVVPGRWTVPLFDPEAVKRAMDDLVAQAGVDLVLSAAVVAAHRDGDRVAAIEYVDFGGLRHVVTAGAFVDASGDAALGALADSGLEVGADGRTQTATMSVRFSGVRSSGLQQVAMLPGAVKAAAAAGAKPLTSSTGFVGVLPVSGDIVAYQPRQPPRTEVPVSYRALRSRHLDQVVALVPAVLRAWVRGCAWSAFTESHRIRLVQGVLAPGRGTGSA